MSHDTFDRMFQEYTRAGAKAPAWDIFLANRISELEAELARERERVAELEQQVAGSAWIP